MPANTLSTQTPPSAEQPVVVSAELRCALTGRALTPEEAYWAPPLITFRDLLNTFATTLFKNPGALGAVLFGEQPNVPFAPEAREELGKRRTMEQLKLLGLILALAALLLVPILMLGS